MGWDGHPLHERFPPSEPCTCDVCTYFCHRPGWPLVEEARLAIELGFGSSLMLELSGDGSFGVLSPAFRGNEGFFALTQYSHNGCTFLDHGLCSIHAQPFLPIECRNCHHDRMGRGKICHQALEKEWHTGKGKRLVRQWQPFSRIPLAAIPFLI